MASRSINEMESIDDAALMIANVPSSYVQPGAIRIDKERAEKKEQGYVVDIKELRGMVALVPIRENEQIVVTKLAPKGTETGLAPQIAANKRALSIGINDESGVSKLLKPGDHVDIIASITYPGPDGNTNMRELKTLLQNVNILAIGEIITNNIPQVYEMDPLSQKKIAVSGRDDRNFATVTVEVTPEQAQILIYARDMGPLYLTLRNPVDRVESPVGSTTVDEVLGPDSKRAEAREKEQRRQQDEQRRLAELERLKAITPAADAPARKPAAVADPLESGGGILE